MQKKIIKTDLSLKKELDEQRSFIEKSFPDIEKEGLKLGSILSEAEQQKDKLGRAVNGSVRNISHGLNLIKKYQQIAKELGVKEDIDEIKKLRKAIDTAFEYQKYFNGLPEIPFV